MSSCTCAGECRGHCTVVTTKVSRLATENAQLRALLAEVIPYAIAGAAALDYREPYGDAWHDRDAHEALCDGADAMLARLRTGGDIATAAGGRS